ncbi:MAG: YbaB/EbfC family nucleoid-associated protein [Thermoanaerobaculia bacterium]
MNIKQMMKQAQQMQAQLQQKMADLRVEGTAGGGIVTAVMSGSKELLEIRIEKEAVDPDDVEMLQDLVLAAVNEASRKVDEEMQGQLGGLAGGMGLPPGMF